MSSPPATLLYRIDISSNEMSAEGLNLVLAPVHVGSSQVHYSQSSLSLVDSSIFHGPCLDRLHNVRSRIFSPKHGYWTVNTECTNIALHFTFDSKLTIHIICIYPKGKDAISWWDDLLTKKSNTGITVTVRYFQCWHLANFLRTIRYDVSKSCHLPVPGLSARKHCKFNLIVHFSFDTPE